MLGNQLFPEQYIRRFRHVPIFIAEDIGLCTYERHHKLKLVLFIAAMRAYEEGLRARGYHVEYHKFSNTTLHTGLSYEDKLADACTRHAVDELVYFEIEDKFMEQRIEHFCRDYKLSASILASPMFITSRAEFAAFRRRSARPLMASFYRQQRIKHQILVGAKDIPVGGKWSFDTENRKRLPKTMIVPEVITFGSARHTRKVQKLVNKHFRDHPGDAKTFWLPVSRDEALMALDDFFRHRFQHFGDFEDAISTRSTTLFHSTLSSSLNVGLLTPREVIMKAVSYADKNGVPLNNLEGFVRQILGWREFIRGIYRCDSEIQAQRNFWKHERQLTPAWYQGETGIPPLDDAIHTARRLGWLHHIQRLMIVGNMFTLCEIQPIAAHRWFMEMFVDASDWVMGPNVYGMALFSDGGIFATKPYLCGSNYMLKMSDYQRGPWCDIVDGLYWRFVAKHQDFFTKHPRLSFMVRSLKRLDVGRRQRIFRLAKRFLKATTLNG